MDFYKILLNLGYEKRKSQEKMFKIINKYLDQEEHFIALIEAPTGTGKSFGYLVPIIEHNQKAIVSTKTKILQEQLRRDLEYLSSIKKDYFGEPIKYLILKGKGNYLCLDRFYDKELQLKQKTIFGTQVDFTKELKDLIDSKAWDGDVEFSSVSADVWIDINVDDNYCDSVYRKACPYLRECFYYAKLRRKEQDTDMLVVNHSLLVLKDFIDQEERLLVIDEAHELDEALVKSATVNLSTIGIMRTISKLMDMLPLEEKDKVNIDIISIFKNIFENYFENKKTNSIPIDEPFFTKEILNLIYFPISKSLQELKSYVIETVKQRIEYKNSVSLTFKNFLKEVLLFEENFIERFSTHLEEPEKMELELIKFIKKYKDVESKVSRIYNTLKYMEDPQNQGIIGFSLSRDFSKQLSDYNYKVEAFPIFSKSTVDLNSYKGVILTSATIDEELIYITTGIEGDYYTLEPEFDYKSVDFIIRKISPKNKELWTQALLDSLKYLRTLHNKVLVLLTSYEQMEQISQASRNANDEGIVFQKNMPLRKAIELLESGEKSVLVGVDSVWTGIDIKGEKGLLMAKLPFDSPSEPLHYYRMKYFENNKDSYYDGFYYSRKKAFVQFKQGFGRLIRSKKDKGTVIMCDMRIWQYEEFVGFLKSLNVKIHYRQQRGD